LTVAQQIAEALHNRGTNMITYKAKSGKMQYKPSLEELEEMDKNQQGFCLACGEIYDGVEPDARRYDCEACGNSKVYGAAELALLGICY
jgi:hypothetical protein